MKSFGAKVGILVFAYVAKYISGILLRARKFPQIGSNLLGFVQIACNLFGARRTDSAASHRFNLVWDYQDPFTLYGITEFGSRSINPFIHIFWFCDVIFFCYSQNSEQAILENKR